MVLPAEEEKAIMDTVKSWGNSGFSAVLTEVLNYQTKSKLETKHEMLFHLMHGVMIESGFVPEMAVPSKYAIQLSAWQSPNGDFKTTYKLAAAASSPNGTCKLWGHAMGRFLVVYGTIVQSETSNQRSSQNPKRRQAAGSQVVRLCLDTADFFARDAKEQASVAGFSRVPEQ
eukprot:6012745-Pyramimonas_sp.AAC.1